MTVGMRRSLRPIVNEVVGVLGDEFTLYVIMRELAVRGRTADESSIRAHLKNMVSEGVLRVVRPGRGRGSATVYGPALKEAAPDGTPIIEPVVGPSSGPDSAPDGSVRPRLPSEGYRPSTRGPLVV